MWPSKGNLLLQRTLCTSKAGIARIAFRPGIGTSITPTLNGDLEWQIDNNTQVTLKLKGSDGTVRSSVFNFV